MTALKELPRADYLTESRAVLARTASVAVAAFAIAAGLAGLCGPAAEAQGRGNDPNLGHFYMARQQITITDDSPVIINKQGGGAGAAAAGVGGMMGGGPPPLPRAGWMPYSQSVPGLSTSLPRTNNGVPPKAPPGPPAGMRAHSKAMKTPKKTTAKSASVPKGAEPVRSYGAYKTYPQQPQQTAAGMSTNNTNTNVRGSVLHWARAAHKGF